MGGDTFPYSSLLTLNSQPPQFPMQEHHQASGTQAHRVALREHDNDGCLCPDRNWPSPTVDAGTQSLCCHAADVDRVPHTLHIH